jgi:hypothetical protein
MAMKMAKASQAEIDAMIEFFNELEELLGRGVFGSGVWASEEANDSVIAEAVRRHWNPLVAQIRPVDSHAADLAIRSPGAESRRISFWRTVRSRDGV